MALRGIAAAQNAVHARLALGDAAAANQRHAEDVVQCRLIGLCGLERGQEVDGVLEFAGSEAAVGEQEREVQVGGLGAVEGFEFGGRFGDLKGLVVGQRQVEAKPGRHVAGRYLQGSLILIDGVLVAAEFGQDGAQIGARLHPVGLGGDAGLVRANGTRKIARLMQLDCTIQGTLGVQSRERQGCEQQGAAQTIRQRIPLTPRTRILALTVRSSLHRWPAGVMEASVESLTSISNALICWISKR